MKSLPTPPKPAPDFAPENDRFHDRKPLVKDENTAPATLATPPPLPSSTTETVRPAPDRPAPTSTTFGQPLSEPYVPSYATGAAKPQPAAELHQQDPLPSMPEAPLRPQSSLEVIYQNLTKVFNNDSERADYKETSIDLDNLFKTAEVLEEETVRTRDNVYLTKYMKTRHGVVFRLSNRVFQLNFFDHTKLILSADGLVTTFINKARKLNLMQTSDAFHDPEKKDIVSRLQYAKEIIYQMILKKQKKTGQQA
ncbi:Serine/threonine-protein kinase plk1 [Phlyctochytrium bullatum]|nr:Serine/threonine-protein kinase plk1 [Phlyctochytrium bullatum]